MGLRLGKSVKLKGTLVSGVGDNILTKDGTTKEIGEVSANITSLTDSYIFVGNASNVPTGVALSGDIAITNAGVVSISSGVIVNADINASAAIALSKLAATTASKALVSDGSGFIIPATTTATQIDFLSTTTSDVQTQINGKQATITGAASTITTSNLNANVVMITDGSGKADDSTVTATELSYLTGTTSLLQTQINGKLSATITSPAQGDIVYYNGSIWVNLARGTNGQTLQSTATSIQWGTVTATGLPTGGTIGQVLAKQSSADYDVVWSTLVLGSITDVSASAAQVNVLATGFYDATSSVQTQLNNKLGTSLASNNIWVGNGSGVATATTDLPTSTTIGSAQIYRVGGTDVTLADGGTGASLSDPGYHAAWVWDNTNNNTRLAQLSGMTYDPSTNTLTATGSVTSVSGTTNRITSSGGATPVIDIAATYVGQTSITTLGTIATGTWSGSVIGTAYGGTGLSSIGTADQLIRVNSGATALEYFTPTYISGNQTITLSGDVTGSGTTAITTTIANSAVTYAKIQDASAGLTVLGRSSNTSGVYGEITAGSDHNILRRSGTSIGFGSIDLSQSGAVGSSILPIANGGTGSSSTVWWALSGTSTVSTPTISGQPTFSGSHIQSSGGTAYRQITLTPTYNTTGTYSGSAYGIDYNPTLTSTTGLTHYAARFVSGVVMIGGTSITAGTAFEISNSAALGTVFRLKSALASTILAIGNDASITSTGGSITSDYAQIGLTASFVPSTGTATYRGFNITPTFNTTGSYVGNSFALDYNPTLTGTTGLTQYGVVIRPAAARSGFGEASPTAKVHLGAGTATASTAPLKFNSGTNLTTPENGAVEYDGTNYFVTSGGTRYTLSKTLTTTATVDIPSVAAGGTQTFTITLTGAVDGDIVSYSIPNAAKTAGLIFGTGWVSAADTISIECYNSTGAPIDPTSATFRVKIARY